MNFFDITSETFWHAAYALGFLDCEDISARCMLSIFLFFATKTDASCLRMLNGSPQDRLLTPITDYIESKGGKLHVRKGCRYLTIDQLVGVVHASLISLQMMKLCMGWMYFYEWKEGCCDRSHVNSFTSFFYREVLYEDGPNGSPFVTGLSMADGSTVTADAYVAALDVPGAKKLIPDSWRKMEMVRQHQNIFL